MTGRSRFRLNSPQVVAETIDGEAIIVNLVTGTYYSLPGDSMLVWTAILDGATVEKMAEAASRATGEPFEAASDAIGEFCASLEEQGLIVPVGENGAGDAPVDFSDGGPGLLEPAYESYSDMRDLVLLDPVHEVEESGWPHAQQSA
jgi:hypothetical protein